MKEIRLLMLTFLLFSLIKSQDLNTIIYTVEQDIIALRDAAELSFKERCTDESVCTHHTCSTILPKLTCNADFLTAACSCFEPGGTTLSMEASMVKLADLFPPAVNPNNQRVQEMVRTGNALNSVFVNLNKKDKAYKWIYFGTSNGVFIGYPGQPSCSAKYDNR